MAVVCTRGATGQWPIANRQWPIANRGGKVYFAVSNELVDKEKANRGKERLYTLISPMADGYWLMKLPDKKEIWERIEELCEETGLSVPEEEIVIDGKRSIWVDLYGYTTFGTLFTPCQLLALLTFTKWVRKAEEEMRKEGYEEELVRGVTTYFGILSSKMADYNATGCRWIVETEAVAGLLGRQSIPMVWDFAELNLFGEAGSNSLSILDGIVYAIKSCNHTDRFAQVFRTSATELPYPDNFFDAIITDPPYYDNVPYADLSDFFYVWLKRSIGHLYPEHFSGELTPKKKEIVADAKRFGGKEKAKKFYENMMEKSLQEAWRVLKPNCPLVMVYAHKTTAGWSTLVEALRKTGFIIQEAWSVHTERPGRLREIGSSALASSIFLCARKREKGKIGSYENEVYPQLEEIVKERVNTLFSKGITGADLVIACVGAGLKAFTQFERVEYANGEEVTSEKFLHIVEGLVLETILQKLFAQSPVATIDVLHRLLWLLENQAYKIQEYLSQSMPNYDLLKLTAQAFAGTTLSGSQELIETTADEKTALSKLLANWKNLISEDTIFRR